MPRRQTAVLAVDPEPLLGSVFATGRVVAARYAYDSGRCNGIFNSLVGPANAVRAARPGSLEPSSLWRIALDAEGWVAARHDS